MPSTSSLRQRPLAHLGLASHVRYSLGGAGLALIERDHRALVDLRIDLNREVGAADSVQKALGVGLPLEANTATMAGNTSVLWLGPNEWLVAVDDHAPDAGPEIAATLRSALKEHFAAVVDVSGAQTVIGITGPMARDVLERAVPLDLHPRAFNSGEVKQTAFGRHCGATLHLLDDQPTFDLYCRRSFAEYVWRYLEDCAVGAETDSVVLAD